MDAPSHADVAVQPDDAETVRRAALRFEGILDRILGSGTPLDRRLLEELSAFLEREAWPAVEANERLVALALGEAAS